VGNVFIAKKFDKCKILLKKFDIYSKIFFRDVGNFFRHLCELVLRHQMRVSNYFVNSFYSVIGAVSSSCSSRGAGGGACSTMFTKGEVFGGISVSVDISFPEILSSLSFVRKF
jgi:hypothetical protein